MVSLPTASISLPFPSEWLPQPAYLVGGSVRDWLLQQVWHYPHHKHKLDLDLVLEKNTLVWASDLANRLNAGYVVLDKDRQIARVVLDHATIDIALQAGSSIESDLNQRDFTCNAIALELHTHTWVDPLAGFSDLAKRQLKMVHPDNLTADPLRLLRAYRQGAQLGFGLDPLTQAAIRQRSGLLAHIAGERVRTEISYLLAGGELGLDWLQRAWQDGILDHWLPGLSEKGFQTAQRVNDWIEKLSPRYPHSLASLSDPLSDQRTGQVTVVLAALLIDQLHLAQLLNSLKYSRIESQWMQRLPQLLPRLQAHLDDNPSPADQFHLFQAARPLFPALALYALATGSALETLTPWLDHYEDSSDPLAHLDPILDGHQAIQALGIRPGRQLGDLLAAVQLAQAIGQITTLDQAIHYARKWLQDPGTDHS